MRFASLANYFFYPRSIVFNGLARDRIWETHISLVSAQNSVPAGCLSLRCRGIVEMGIRGSEYEVSALHGFVF